MENDYVFNYDEVKRRFESVPQANKLKSLTYKTRFQPRTKSIMGKYDSRSKWYPLMTHRIQREERLSISTMTFQVQVVHVQQIKSIDQSCLQSQQRLISMPICNK